MDCKDSYCSCHIQGYSGIENGAMLNHYTTNLWSLKSNPTWNFLFYDLTWRFTPALAYSKISGGCSNNSFWNFEHWSLRHRTKLQLTAEVKKKNICCWEQSWSAVSLSTGELIKGATREFSMFSSKEGTIGNTFTYSLKLSQRAAVKAYICPSMDTKLRGKNPKQTSINKNAFKRKFPYRGQNQPVHFVLINEDIFQQQWHCGNSVRKVWAAHIPQRCYCEHASGSTLAENWE